MASINPRAVAGAIWKKEFGMASHYRERTDVERLELMTTAQLSANAHSTIRQRVRMWFVICSAPRGILTNHAAV